MSRLDEYTFLVTDLLTGDILDVVELGSFYWEEIYNRPGAGLATARFDLPTTTPENFKDWSNALWAVKDGVIQWGGIIGKVQRRGGTRVISVPVHGFFEYFRNRFLRDDTGMTFGNVVRVSDIEWRNVDQFHVFKDMIDHAQSFTDGDIGIGVEWDALSGQPVTMIYRKFTVKEIGAALTTLSARLNGFDFRQVYRFEDGKPRCNFKLTSPPHSTTRDVTLLFQTERSSTRVDTVRRALDLSGAIGTYANGGDVTKVAGDIDIIVSARLDDWSSGSVQTLRSKWSATDGNRSWRFTLLGDGRLRFQWTTNGFSATQTAVNGLTAVSFGNGEEGTVRVTLDASEDRVTFYESTDGGTTWLSLTSDPYEATFPELY